MDAKSARSESTRRKFFKDTGRKAVWAAPTLTVLMSASKLSAWGTKGSGTRTYEHNYDPEKLKKLIYWFKSLFGN